MPGFSEESRELVDRNYWEQRGSVETVRLAERILDLVSTFAPGFELKFNKYYVGLAREGQAPNFVEFQPRRTSLRVEIKVPEDEETSLRVAFPDQP